MHDMHLYNFYRLLIAALHFNENYNRVLAKTASRNEWIQIVYPKHKQGEFTPKPVPVPKTYSMSVMISTTIYSRYNFRLC